MFYKLKLKRPDAVKSSLMTEFMKNGVPFKLYTGKTIHTKNWSSTKQAVLSGEENYDIINKYLDNWKNETNRIIETFQADKIRLTKEAIQIQLDKAFKKDYIEKKEDAINDFTSFMDFYLDKKKDKKRNLQRLNQVKKLVLVAFNLVSKKHLAEWQKLSSSQKSRTNLKADKKLSFEEVNLKFIESFRAYMYTAKFTVGSKANKVEKIIK